MLQDTASHLAQRVSLARDVSQIAFFVVIGAITVLTYLKVRDTLLQPIKTEVFKEQVKLFAEILSLFSGKREHALRGDLEFSNFVRVNAWRLLDDYGATVFGLEVDEDDRPYNVRDCPYALLDGNTLVDVDVHIEEPSSTSPPSSKNAWAQYKFTFTSIPRALHDAQEQLHRLKSSPLVPKRLAELIEHYESAIEKDISRIKGALTHAASELPGLYPDPDSLRRASLMWLENRYELTPLEPKAQAITQYLRDYFFTDRLIPPT